MLPGVRYYSNVVAYTFSGLQTTVSSDGIMIDNSPPVTGVVDDGLGLFQSISFRLKMVYLHNLSFHLSILQIPLVIVICKIRSCNNKKLAYTKHLKNEKVALHIRPTYAIFTCYKTMS